MNYADIKSKDTANGQGFGVSLFVSGCRNHCKGCFNPETWDFDYGESYTDEIQNKIFELINRPYVDFFSILGGDPFEPENKGVVLDLVTKVRDTYPNLVINIWSGYLFEDLIKDDVSRQILSNCTNLVDGKYESDKYDYKLLMRGSSNQRVIKLADSLLYNCIILNEDLMKSY